MHVEKICDRIISEIDEALESRLGKVPHHIHNPKSKDDFPPETLKQTSLPLQ